MLSSALLSCILLHFKLLRTSKPPQERLAAKGLEKADGTKYPIFMYIRLLLSLFFSFALREFHFQVISYNCCGRRLSPLLKYNLESIKR